jgi:hypothetical protein
MHCQCAVSKPILDKDNAKAEQLTETSSPLELFMQVLALLPHEVVSLLAVCSRFLLALAAEGSQM